jgi:hypothetical protein
MDFVFVFIGIIANFITLYLGMMVAEKKFENKIYEQKLTDLEIRLENLLEKQNRRKY